MTMKSIFKYAVMFTTLLCLAACGGGEDTPTDDPNNGNPDVPEQVAALTISVTNITATAARVSVTPQSKTTKYYFDILRAEYYREYNEQFGFQRFINNTINSLMDANSMTKEDVLSRILSAGDDSYGFTGLDADTEYYAVAMGIDQDGLITTEIYFESFKTAAVKPSDNTFAIDIKSVSYESVAYSVKPKNNEPYVLIYWNKPIVDKLGDKFIDHCIESRSDIESFVVTGSQTGVFNDCVPGRDYYLVAFGFDGGLPTTAITKASFTTKADADPSQCKFTFAVSDIQYDRAYMKVTPSAKHTPFFWSVVEKSYYEELVRTVGAEEGMKSVLAESLAPFATDFGNIYDALEIITSYNDVSVEGTTYGLEQGKEYIPWAVAIDNSGNATAEFVMGNGFKTKIDTVADCTVEVKGSFETGSDGKAVLISTAKPDDKCVNFYNVIFQGDLRDASRQSLLNNIIKMGFKNQREVKFEKCPWNQPASAIAVGVDADGNFGEIAIDVFIPIK